ncbi:hypothetical protein SDJN03_04049, partial [Cucurbita argyrosperma subsp. sororia]
MTLALSSQPLRFLSSLSISVLAATSCRHRSSSISPVIAVEVIFPHCQVDWCNGKEEIRRRWWKRKSQAW